MIGQSTYKDTIEHRNMIWEALKNAAFLSMQLPYLNEKGSPRVVDLKHGDAYSLYCHKVVKILWCEGGAICVPIIPAAQNVVFQVGEEPV